MAFQTEHIQIDGSLNVDGSIFQYGVEFSGGGGVTSLNDLTDVSVGSPGNDNVLQYDSGSGKWAKGTTPPFRHLANLSPRSFPYIDGTYDVSILTTQYSGYVNVQVKIVPDGTFTIYFGNDVIRTVSSNITQSQNIPQTVADRGYVFDTYAGPGLAAGSNIYSTKRTVVYEDDDFILATLKFDPSANLISTINWSTFDNSGAGDYVLKTGDTMSGDLSINDASLYVGGKTNSANGFETTNFEIVHNATSDTLDFNYIG